jgi:hypothetical protein
VDACTLRDVSPDSRKADALLRATTLAERYQRVTAGGWLREHLPRITKTIAPLKQVDFAQLPNRTKTKRPTSPSTRCIDGHWPCLPSGTALNTFMAILASDLMSRLRSRRLHPLQCIQRLLLVHPLPYLRRHDLCKAPAPVMHGCHRLTAF